MFLIFTLPLFPPQVTTLNFVILDYWLAFHLMNLVVYSQPSEALAISVKIVHCSKVFFLFCLFV